MDKAPAPLEFPIAPSRQMRSEISDASVTLSGGARCVAFLPSRMPPRRSSALSMAAPASPAGLPSETTLERLRQRILAIERPKLEVRHGFGEEPGTGETPAELSRGPRTAAWSLGMPEADALIGAHGLDTAACHEIKPEPGKTAQRAAALGFALALARRRLGETAHAGRGLPRILWCTSRPTNLDTGHLYPPGLARFGLDAASFLFIDARRDGEVLWALEEGLRSGSLALAIGSLSAIGLTPARRLSLAARDGATPLLLLTSARSAPSAATATRWRIGTAVSSPHPFDPKASGAARIAVRLERCRSAPPAMQAAMTLEWSDEAYRFRMASALADRTAEAAPARRRAG